MISANAELPLQRSKLTLLPGRLRWFSCGGHRRRAREERALVDVDEREGGSGSGREAPAGGADLRRRLAKTVRHLARWRRRQAVECWRLYDRDLPQYPAVVDVYGERVHLQEFAAEADGKDLTGRMQELARVVSEVLEIPRSQVFFKQRMRQREGQRHDRREGTGSWFQVQEGGQRFWINFTSRLDPGLFLDHRSTRAMVREKAAGRRFLNLFCYTASFSVYAAAGGAAETWSVDLSSRTLRWARRNLDLNGFRGEAHHLVRADCLNWMAEQGADPAWQGYWDLAVLDPPTFSNSKGMGGGDFDVQRDHVRLIRDAMRLVSPGGILLFSNNRRKFKLDVESLSEFELKDLGAATLPKDFERNPGVHHCTRIRHRPSGSQPAWEIEGDE